jgi:hypothetical protein
MPLQRNEHYEQKEEITDGQGDGYLIISLARITLADLEVEYRTVLD